MRCRPGKDTRCRQHRPKYRTEAELRRQYTRAIHGQPDLLLMMPAFGELARGIEPVGRCVVARPTHRKGRRRKGVQGAVEFRTLARSHLHERNEHRWTEAAIDPDAILVEAVNQ